MGCNLPPGVEDHMIPGNTKEDREWDELFAWLTQLDIEVAEIRTAIDIYIEIITNPAIKNRFLDEWMAEQRLKHIAAKELKV